MSLEDDADSVASFSITSPLSLFFLELVPEVRTVIAFLSSVIIGNMDIFEFVEFLGVLCNYLLVLVFWLSCRAGFMILYMDI